MRSISVVITGSRSDLQPYLSLSDGLRTNGFDVRIVTHGVHQEEVHDAGFDFFALKGDPNCIMQSSTFRDGVLEGGLAGGLRIAALFKAEADKFMEVNMKLILDGCKTCDAILCNISVLTPCLAICQKRQIPLLLCPLLPFSPSGEVGTR